MEVVRESPKLNKWETQRIGLRRDSQLLSCGGPFM